MNNGCLGCKNYESNHDNGFGKKRQWCTKGNQYDMITWWNNIRLEKVTKETLDCRENNFNIKFYKIIEGLR